MTDRDESAVYREQAQTIGQHLAECMEQSGLSRRSTARAVSVHEATLVSWLHGKQKPSPKYAKRIEREFPGMAEVFELHGTGEVRISKRRKLRDQSRAGKSKRMTAAAKRRRLYLIEERHRVMQARRKREERMTNEQEA